MTQTQVQTRPKWATLAAAGFFAVGFGALLLAIGLVSTLDMLLVVGSGLVALGVALGSFGGYGYFIEKRQ